MAMAFTAHNPEAGIQRQLWGDRGGSKTRRVQRVDLGCSDRSSCSTIFAVQSRQCQCCALKKLQRNACRRCDIRIRHRHRGIHRCIHHSIHRTSVRIHSSRGERSIHSRHQRRQRHQPRARRPRRRREQWREEPVNE